MAHKCFVSTLPVSVCFFFCWFYRLFLPGNCNPMCSMWFCFQLFRYHKFQFTSKQIYNWWMLVSFQLNYISVFFHKVLNCASKREKSGKKIIFFSLSFFFFSSLESLIRFLFFFFHSAYPRILPVFSYQFVESCRATRVEDCGFNEQNEWMCLIIK